MEKKYILGLDVSTSTIGISLFTIDGQLVELNHISPVIKDDSLLQHQELLEKVKVTTNFLAENYPKEGIGEIYIETPLISSQQIDTAALLNYFGGMFYGILSLKYPDAKVEYITVDEARRNALPETLGKKNTLFGAFNEKFENQKLTDHKKLIVMALVAQKFPSIVWLLNNNLTIDKKNFDRADSIVVALGKKIKNGEWVPNIVDVEKAKEFVKRNIVYEQFVAGLKGIDKKEKDAMKYNYLKQTFEIELFINVAI